MLQWILRVLLLVVLRHVLVLVLLPVALIVSTPFILVRALLRSHRQEQTFRVVVSDSYSSVWDGFIAAFTWPFVTDADRLQSMRRQSSNQAMQRTADRSDA